MDGYERANKILSEQREELEKIAEALLEYETLDGEDIDVVLGGGKIERRPPPAPRAPDASRRPRRSGRSIFARPPGSEGRARKSVAGS